MADSPPVDDSVTDAVAQTNLKVLGEAPAVAISSLYQAAAQSISTSMQNAVNAQQQMTTFAQAAAAKSVDLLQNSQHPTGIEDLLGIPFLPTDDEENN